jgi:two-component system chemotaxis sensor kinase CheA
MAKDPYRFFRVEARELVEQLSSGAVGLDQSDTAKDEVARLLRLAHTLKGAARVVKQVEIADLAHAVEDELAPCREGALAVDSARVDAVLVRLDAINAALARLPAAEESRQPHTPEAAATGPAAPTGATRLVRTDLRELGELLDGLSEIGREMAGIGELAALLTQSHDIAAALVAQAGRRGYAAGPQLQSAAVHAQAETLSDLLAAAGRKLGMGMERVGRELQQAKETAERLRLIPAASVFPMLERTCRDAAQSIARQAALETAGGDVLLDGQVLEVLQSALAQLVRNAVAHGIESLAERRAAGKPERGAIRLQVTRHGYRAVFRCSDDGRGIDFAAVSQAIGHATPDVDRTTLLTELFRGGVSTAGTVTQIAGRGIGLDLVREAMARLGGEVHAESEPGVGTTVELYVPLSMAAFEALLVELNGQTVALPLESVRRTLRMAAEEVVRTADGDAVMVDGQLVPVVSPALAGRKTPRTRQNWSGVLLASDGQTAVLAVDRLLGAESIVLRPLPAMAVADAIVLGSCVDKEGNPRLVIDPGVLVSGKTCTEEEAAAQGALEHPILVIDDSLTTRMLEQSILESAGLPVETASSAEEALLMADRNAYSLFLTDVEMPGMDGFTFVERTRAHPRLHRVPCIMVTSCDTSEHRQRARDAGASGYIVKSQFDQSEFLQHIYRLVQA